MSKKRKRRDVSYRDWITEDGLVKLEGMARDGLVNEQIAKNIGIAEGTLYRWINEYSEIGEALKRGKEVIDREVENALLKRALGYEIEEVKTYMEDSDGKRKKRVEKTTKHIAPDVTAQIFWLKNRKPVEWGDRQTEAHIQQAHDKAMSYEDILSARVEDVFADEG